MGKALLTPRPHIFTFSGPTLSAPPRELSPVQSGRSPCPGHLRLRAFVPSLLLCDAFPAPLSFHLTVRHDHSPRGSTLQHIAHLLGSYCVHGRQRVDKIAEKTDGGEPLAEAERGLSTQPRHKAGICGVSRHFSFIFYFIYLILSFFS